MNITFVWEGDRGTGVHLAGPRDDGIVKLHVHRGHLDKIPSTLIVGRPMLKGRPC